MKNNTKILIATFMIVFFLSTFNMHAFGGWFSNDEYKKWAKKAIKQEKSLKPTKGTLAVLYFNNQSGNKDYNSLQKGLALMLIDDYSKIKQKGFQVVERGKLQALVDELKLGMSGLVKPDTAPRVGKLMGAETILYGDLLSDKKTELKVNPEMLNVNKKEPIKQKDVQGQLAKIVQIEKNILNNSLISLKVKVTKEERKLLEIPLSEKPEALENLFIAVDWVDQENWGKAEPYFIKSFTIDPNLLKIITELVKDIAPTVLSATAAVLFIKKLNDMKKKKGKKKSPGMSLPTGIPKPKFP
jgi:TolB-like protein